MAYLDYQHGDEATKEQRKQLRMKWLGPSRKEVWTRLAEEMSAQYEKRFWKGDRVVVDAPPWQVVLDVLQTDKVAFTRIRAPYINADGFRFCVFRRHFFSGVVEALGGTDIEVGDPEFDRDFVIRGNDPHKVRLLLGNHTLRSLLTTQPKVKFEVRDNDDGLFKAKFPPDVDQLRFFVAGIIKDIDHLKLLYDLFAETLNELCRMGSAEERDPGIRI